jgi:hypothetical protein
MVVEFIPFANDLKGNDIQNQLRPFAFIRGSPKKAMDIIGVMRQLLLFRINS